MATNYTDDASATTAPPAWWDESQTSHLSLNLLERLWVQWYAYFQNDTIATGIMTFAVHEVFYFGRCVVWALIDAVPFFRKWKIQEEKVPSAAEQWQCAALVLLTHVTVELPEIWFFHPIATTLSVSTGVPFPSLPKALVQVAVFFVAEDAWHYWTHRLMHHSSYLYRTVHKVHHRYTAPFGLAAEYASPIEIMVLGLGTVGSPLVWAALTHDLHMVTMYLWIVLRLLQAVDSHSGYDFPWSLRRWVPFWAGAEHHDVHHERFKGNYASSFRWWDYFMGTETMSKREREEVAEREKKRQ